MVIIYILLPQILLYRVPETPFLYWPVHVKLQIKPFFKVDVISKMQFSLNVLNLASTQNGSHFSGEDMKAVIMRTLSFVKQFRKVKKVPSVLTLENSKRSILCQ